MMPVDMFAIKNFPLKQFVRYSVVGGSGFIIDLASLVLLRDIFGWNAVLAVAVNQSFIIIINFTLNKYWSFESKHLPHRQFVRYLLLAGLNYILAVAIMAVFHGVFAIDYRIVRIANIALSVSWNFYLYRHWVYKEVHKDN